MLFKILNPSVFLKITKKVRKYIGFFGLIFFVYGLYLSLLASPEDYQQKDMVRIMYIHVPSAWLSLMIFMIMGLASVSNLVWKTPLSFFITAASAPIGASFALITLVTGMIWGKPIWGTWWVWDARLTSMLILFIFYISYLFIISATNNIQKVEKPSSVIAIVGMINVPIVKFSVNLWYSLHQGASVIKAGGPSIDISMLLPLLVMFLANFCLYLVLLFYKMEILLRKNVVCSN